MNPCVLFSGIPHYFQEYHTHLIFRKRAEWIPPVYGIDSARIRNAFRRATEYRRNVVFLKIVHTGSCIPVIV